MLFQILRHLCSCDNEFGKYGFVGSADCNCPCMGDPQERCGCELRQKVYQLDVVQTNQKKYYGDYRESIFMWLLIKEFEYS